MKPADTINAPILFWGTAGRYGFLSDFFGSKILIGHRMWPTVEHFFQAQKFLDTAVREHIRTQPTPAMARRAGRRKDLPLRSDWEAVKEHAMLEGLRAKFGQYPLLRQRLLGTGDRPLIEASPHDFYRGIGDGSGKNRLGALLMQVREEC